MRQADVGAVAELEQYTYEFPWSEGIFRDCLLAGYLNVVLDRGGEVVGYGIMSVAAREAHLLNICVVESLRRQGIGQNLLQYLSIAMYRAFGFEVLGVREHYYKAHGGSEDAVVLVRHFGDDEDRAG